MIRLLWYLFFLVPLTFLLEHLAAPHLEASRVVMYLGQALSQSILSVFAILIIGFFLALGLLALPSNRWRRTVEVLLVIPSMVPVLFVVVSTLSWITALHLPFSPGLPLVVWVHTLLNAGLCAVLWTDLIETKAGSVLTLAAIEGARPWRVYGAVFRAYWKDILLFAAGFFGLCFTSFSVPLLVGGRTGGTLEILIYRLLTVEGDLTAAVTVAFLQLLCFGLLFWSFGDARTRPLRNVRGPLFRHYAWPAGLWIFAPLVLIFSFGGMIFGLASGVREIWHNEILFNDICGLLGPTLMQTLLAGGVSALLYVGLMYLADEIFIRRMAFAFGALSTVILGLAFYLMPGPSLLKIPLAMAYLFFPVAYRLFGARTLNQMQNQILVAKIMGASRWRIFRGIVLPQALPSCWRIFGLVCFWSVGEYGIAVVISGEKLNLAVLAKSLLSGYHLEPAVALSWMLLGLGVALWIFSYGMAYVSDQKLAR